MECCQQNLSLLPVEFYFLLQGLRQLPKETRSRLGRHPSSSGPCVLLHGGGCLLYDRRPIICRTHGLPLLISEDGKQRRDCCPKNFAAKPLDHLPERDILHLDRLNALLVSVNMLFALKTGMESGGRIKTSRLAGEIL
ncbi:MAG: YkgJ family cysteine cluster protein [Syntrophobacteria bacterium]